MTNATSPVFIVGLPRSGTTLMAVCLDRHPAFDCGPETHLFPHLATADGRAALEPDGWPQVATDLLCALALDGIPIHQSAGISRQRIADQLAARPPSTAAMMEALVATQAADAGKARWIEKTPRHLDFVPLIRATWPDASIIHMVRDPRSRALSMTRVPFGSSSVVRNLLDGVQRERRARPALELDPRIIKVRLEDLAADPKRELTRVCSFLGEEYSDELVRPSHAPAAVGPAEWWKQRASEAIEPPAVDAWANVMDPALRRFAGLYCADQIRQDGYPDPGTPRLSLVVVPVGTSIISSHEPFALSLASADVVVDDAPVARRAGLRRADLVAFWGKPGQLLPTTDGRTTWGDVGGMALDLAVRRARLRPTWWIRERTRRSRDSHSAQERWFARILRLLARHTTGDELAERILRDAAAAERIPQGPR